MTDKQHNQLTLAILVRMFPNIVQTYVLNHIVSMKISGVSPVIVAESPSSNRETHPAVTEHHLLDDTLYISADRHDAIKQLKLAPWSSSDFRALVRQLAASPIWRNHGIKYGLKALLRARVLARGKPDIIHSHSLFCSYDYLFMKEVFGIPFTTTFHGLVPNNVKMLDRNKITKVIDASDAFFVNTNFALAQLADFGCPTDRIHIIPQGTNTKEFPFRERSIRKDEPVVVVSVGRLSIEKGFHIAIRAMARLAKRYPNIEYRIIGTGLEENNLKDLIRSEGLGNTVRLCGSLPTEELLHHYRQANIFVLPSIDLRDGSHTETQGVVLQEAQASGIPVIASRTGGIPEVVKDGVTGLLFDESNDRQLANHIEDLITDNNLYQSISRQGRKDVEDNFSVEVIQKRLADVYSDLLGSTRPAPGD